MSESKKTMTKADQRKAKCYEALDYLDLGVQAFIARNEFSGAQISTVFKTEVLERIDLHALRVLVPAAKNGDQQFIAWVNSKEFDQSKIDEKKKELGEVTCAGSRETGRLWSQDWLKRMRNYEDDVRKELKDIVEDTTAVHIIKPIFVAWMQFAAKYVPDVKGEETVAPKGMTQRQHIAQLLARVNELEAEESALDSNKETVTEIESV